MSDHLYPVCQAASRHKHYKHQVVDFLCYQGTLRILRIQAYCMLCHQQQTRADKFTVYLMMVMKDTREKNLKQIEKIKY